MKEIKRYKRTYGWLFVILTTIAAVCLTAIPVKPTPEAPGVPIFIIPLSFSLTFLCLWLFEWREENQNEKRYLNID